MLNQWIFSAFVTLLIQAEDSQKLVGTQPHASIPELQSKFLELRRSAGAVTRSSLSASFPLLPHDVEVDNKAFYLSPYGEESPGLDANGSVDPTDVSVLLTVSPTTLPAERHIEEIEKTLSALERQPFLRGAWKYFLADGVPSAEHQKLLDPGIVEKWGSAWKQESIQEYARLKVLLRESLERRQDNRLYFVEFQGLHGAWGMLRKGLSMIKGDLVMLMQQDFELNNPELLRMREIASMVKHSPTVRIAYLHCCQPALYIFRNYPQFLAPLARTAQSFLSPEAEVLLEHVPKKNIINAAQAPKFPRSLRATRVLGYSDNPHIAKKEFYDRVVTPLMEQHGCLNDGEIKSSWVTKFSCFCVEHILPGEFRHSVKTGRMKAIDYGMIAMGNPDDQVFFRHNGDRNHRYAAEEHRELPFT